MGAFPFFQQSLFVLSLTTGFVLCTLLLLRRSYRIYPAFAFYAFLSLAQGTLLFLAYHRWAFASMAAWRIGWISQAIVICARAFAVVELCRSVLAQYKGVWALAWRIFIASASLVLLYSLVSSKHEWVSALPSAERGLDLAIASAIVGIFLFARYYAVSVDPVVRILALGFFLFSCFGVLNDTILERWLYNYSALWNILNSLTFLASLSLWTWALRLPRTAPIREKVLLPETVYSTMGFEVNRRLYLLNESLSHFWNAGARQP